MNCKQGDLAIVVSSINPNSPNIGKVVRCIEFVQKGFMVDGIGKTAFDGWRIDIDLERYKTKDGSFVGVSNLASDKNLRSIRDNKGKDETLTWAGKPKKVSS